MEIGASHFIRLELVTQSQISTPFVKDLTRMARSVVEHARNPEQQGINVGLRNAEGSNLLSLGSSSEFDLAAPRERDFAESSFDEVSILACCVQTQHLQDRKNSNCLASGSTCSWSRTWRFGALSFPLWSNLPRIYCLHRTKFDFQCQSDSPWRI